jgi:phosphoribosylanthranilate isomerase
VADPGAQELAELEVAGGHQVVQLHGGESVERCRQLGDRLGVELWKALRIRSPQDLERAHLYAGAVDALLLDAWVSDQLGGTGHRIPIEWLHGFTPALPWWLAGGITPERVVEVLAHLQPHGLDASSGVEDAPGRKNLQRVKALVAAVHAGKGAGVS